MIWVNAAKQYLGAFAAKDIETLTEMYADNVELADWVIHTFGKAAVLEANKAFFLNTKMINISIQNTAYRDKLICVEFVLVGFPEATNTYPYVLNIVDIIQFDSYGKIKSIRAYKR
jgi:hypothetical protein